MKLGFTGVCIIFLIIAQKHRLCTRYNRLAEAVLTSTYNLRFEQKYEKYQSFLSENFQFLEVIFSIYLNSSVFVMRTVVFYNSQYDDMIAVTSELFHTVFLLSASRLILFHLDVLSFQKGHKTRPNERRNLNGMKLLTLRQ